MSQSNVEIGDEVQGWLSDHHYKEGFYTDISTDTLEKGLNEAVVRAISAKRNEPEWMLEFRLDAYRHWLEMEEPHWLKADYPSLNYQDYSYYSAPSCSSCCANGSCAGGSNEAVMSDKQATQDYLTKEVEDAFNQLGVPVREGQAVAVDAIFDSVSVSTTYS